MARERKDLNPADRHRKEQRKKELKKNKRERKEVQVFAALVRDPDTMAKAITELEEKYEEGKATAGDLEKLAQYKRTYKDIMKKREKAWKAHGEESGAAADKYGSALNPEQQHNITEQKEVGSAPQPTSSPYTPGFPPGLNPDVSSLPPPPPLLLRSQLGLLVFQCLLCLPGGYHLDLFLYLLSDYPVDLFPLLFLQGGFYLDLSPLPHPFKDIPRDLCRLLPPPSCSDPLSSLTT